MGNLVSFCFQNNSVSKSENGDASRSHDGSCAAISVGSGRIDVTTNDTFGFKIDLEDLQSVKADVQVISFIYAMNDFNGLST